MHSLTTYGRAEAWRTARPTRPLPAFLAAQPRVLPAGPTRAFGPARAHRCAETLALLCLSALLLLARLLS